jgi:hypothetical protein
MLSDSMQHHVSNDRIPEKRCDNIVIVTAACPPDPRRPVVRQATWIQLSLLVPILPILNNTHMWHSRYLLLIIAVNVAAFLYQKNADVALDVNHCYFVPAVSVSSKNVRIDTCTVAALVNTWYS